MVCNLLVNVFALLLCCRMIVKTSRKTPLSPHSMASFFERELFFLLYFAFVSKTDSTHTNNSFKRRKTAGFFFFKFLCCPFNSQTTKNIKKLFIRRTLLRPQKQEIRIYFGLAAIYYLPCHNIVLSSWTRWIIIQTFAGQIRRSHSMWNCMQRHKQEKKINPKSQQKSIRRKTLTCFLSIWILLHDCYI